MTSPDTAGPNGIDPDRLSRIVDIIGRYPDTSRAENDDAVTYLREGPITDRNRLLNMAVIQDQLYQFQSDHQQQLSIPLRAYLVVTAMLVMVVGMAVWLLWDAGA